MKTSANQPVDQAATMAVMSKVSPNPLSIDPEYLRLIGAPVPTPASPANAAPASATMPSEPVDPLSDEEVYWVVIQGGFPGVYKGKSAANCAAWNFDRVAVKVVKAGPRRQQADRRFVDAFMKGEVEFL